MQSPQEETAIRNRRIYTLPSDREIYRILARYQYLTVEQVTAILKRDVNTVQKRLQALFQSGYLNRQRYDGFSPYVYFFDEKGGNLAAGYGYLESPRWIFSKAPSGVPHDLEITNIHLALEKGLHDHGHVISYWHQWRGDFADLVDLTTDTHRIPDARFGIDGERPSHLEVVRSYEWGYKKQDSSFVYKLFFYETLDLERVYVVMPTKARVLNFLAKIEADLPSIKLWFTDEESCMKNTMGKIWWTPRNFRDKTYSILKPKP